MPSEQLLDTIQTEKQEVKGYFETTGFDRWNRIYSDSDEVNKVQRNIRIGHQKTVDNVLAWLQEQGNLANRSFCDAGCRKPSGGPMKPACRTARSASWLRILRA